MSNPKMLKVLQKLYAKTMQGKVEWEETEQREVYQAAFPGYAVRISTRQTVQEGSGIDYVLSIFNDEGTKIDDISDVDIDPKEIPNPFLFMMSLHDAARRKALGVDVALDKLLAELDEEELPF